MAKDSYGEERVAAIQELIHGKPLDIQTYKPPKCDLHKPEPKECPPSQQK